MAISLNQTGAKLYHAITWVPEGNPEPLDQETLDSISTVVTEQGKWGVSVRFTLKNGDYTFLMLDGRDPTPVDTICKKELITLQKLVRGTEEKYKVITGLFPLKSEEEMRTDRFLSLVAAKAPKPVENTPTEEGKGSTEPPKQIVSDLKSLLSALKVVSDEV